MNIAVFASGNGSNLQALIEAEKKNSLSGGRISLVFSDRPDAYALKRAEEEGIRRLVLEPGKTVSSEEFDELLTENLKKEKIGLVALAGYMRILSPAFVSEYSGRLLNIHPSLLPAFKGANGIRDAFEAGVKVTGVTVHFVTDDLDAGPIVAQTPVKVEEGETVASLEEKIHHAEHVLYPRVVSLFVSGKLKIEGKKVSVLD